MRPQFDSIDAVILDLGGVILNIDYQRTISAFKVLGFKNFDEQYSKMQQSGLFDQLEVGAVSEQEFVDQIKAVIPHATHEQIIAAWNALIIDFPEGRIETVKAIANRFPTYLLSNTNAIHYPAFSKVLFDQTGLKEIETLFVRAYLSHEIHLRKPDLEAFQLILDEHQLDPTRTLFVDDSPQHVEAAGKCRIQTYHMKDGDSLERLFAPILT